MHMLLAVGLFIISAVCSNPLNSYDEPTEEIVVVGKRLPPQAPIIFPGGRRNYIAFQVPVDASPPPIELMSNVREQDEESACWRELTGNEGILSSPFGATSGRRSPHIGIDIAANRGTAVYTLVAGKVIAIESGLPADDHSTSNGNFVVIRAMNGSKHDFYHLLSTAVQEQETVEAGTQIGTVNNTGRSTGDHLHYHYTDADGDRKDPTEVFGCGD